MVNAKDRLIIASAPGGVRDEIIDKPRLVRLGVQRQNLQHNLAHHARWNYIVLPIPGEPGAGLTSSVGISLRRTGTLKRIIDAAIAVNTRTIQISAHIHAAIRVDNDAGWHGGGHGSRLHFAPTFETGEEVSLVLLDGAAKSPPEIVLVMKAFGLIQLIQLIEVGVENRIAPIVIDGAVKCIRALLDYYINGSASAASHAGIVVARLDFEFLHRIDIGCNEPRSAGGAVLLRDRSSIHSELFLIVHHSIDLK